MRILTLARGDLRLTLRDGSAIFWMFIAPFLWVWFFSFMNRSSDPSHTRVSLHVVQEDASPLADRFVDLLRAENFALQVVKPGAAAPESERTPPRTLTVPSGFAEAVAARRKVTLDLSESDRASAEGTFAVQVGLHRAIVRLLAGEAFGGLPAEKDAVRVRTSWAAGRKTPSGFYQTIPGNLVMFVLMSTLAYGSAFLVQERKNGLLRRLAASPLGRSELILGKLAGRAVIAGVQALVFIFIGLAVFRIDWGDSPLALAAVLLSLILCASALGLLLGTLFASADAASGAGVVAMLAMSALGGCWWPAEVMPRWLQNASHAFPTAWAMEGLHGVISWGGGLGDVLLPCTVLLAFGLGAGTLAARRLRLTE